MPQKNTPNVAGRTLRKYIAEARRLREGQKRALAPGLPPTIWPAWPYIDSGALLESKIAKQIGSPESSKNQIAWRLKQFAYPYPEGNKRGRTFYEHIHSLGLLDVVANPPLLWEIRRVWWFQQFYREEVALRTKKRSEYGHALTFHRELMFECSSHLQHLEKLLKTHHVNRTWIEKYRKAVLERLLHEAAIYYPQLLRWPKPAGEISPVSHAVDMRLHLYDEMETAFAGKKIEGKRVVNHKLAEQLTALMCSSQQTIGAGKLDPTPGNVRSNIRDRKSPQGK